VGGPNGALWHGLSDGRPCWTRTRPGASRRWRRRWTDRYRAASVKGIHNTQAVECPGALRTEDTIDNGQLFDPLGTVTTIQGLDDSGIAAHCVVTDRVAAAAAIAVLLVSISSAPVVAVAPSVVVERVTKLSSCACLQVRTHLGGDEGEVTQAAHNDARVIPLLACLGKAGNNIVGGEDGGESAHRQAPLLLQELDSITGGDRKTPDPPIAQEGIDVRRRNSDIRCARGVQETV